MKDVLKYKEYIGSVQFSSEDEVFYGKLEGIDDLITFEADNVKKLKSAFKDAVEDYKKLCLEAGKTPEKSYKGSFNIRIDPALHKKAVRRSIELGLSLNQLVEKAIANILQEPEEPPYNPKSE